MPSPFSGEAGEKFASYLLSGEDRLEQTPAGKMLRDIVDKAEVEFKSIFAKEMPSIKSASPATRQQTYSQTTKTLVQHGLLKMPTGRAIPFQPVMYHPHEALTPPDKFSPLDKGKGKLYEELVNHLVQSNQYASRDEAKVAVRQQLMKYNSRRNITSFYAPDFLAPLSKFAAPEDLTWTEWQRAATKGLVQHKWFGTNDFRLHRLISQAHLTTDSIAHRDALYDLLQIKLYDRSFGSSVAGKFGESPSSTERKIRNIFSTAMTPMIAVQHLSQGVNMFLDRSIPSIVKGVFKTATDYRSAATEVANSGALIDETYGAVKDIMLGKPSKWSYWFKQVYHQPAFKMERAIYAVLAGQSAKYEAVNLAERLLKNPNDKRATTMFKVFGLDAAQVKNGKLTPEQLDTVMQYGVKNILFEKDAFRTPYAWEKDWKTRAASMYKHYAYNEGRFVYKAIRRLHYEDPARAAQVLLTLGVIFPLVGQGQKMAYNKVSQLLALGDEPKQPDVHPLYDITKHYTNDITPNNPVDEYIDDVGHLAAFGLWTEAIKATEREGLVKWLVGPQIDRPTRFIEQVAKAKLKPAVHTAGSMLGVGGRAFNHLVDKVLPDNNNKRHRGRGHRSS